jgi:F-type H+-transporting ATPase subunit delta
MIDLVAKRYVKALMADRDKESLAAVYSELSAISSAYNDDKFILIISSSEIEVGKKIELILSFAENCGDTTKNLIKLLASKKRLDILPSIVESLKQELAVINNKYEGVVYTNKELSSSDLENLNAQFAKKFNVELELTQNVCDYNGVKVDIDGLGVEVSFSKERLKSQMIEHILKAV